MSFLLAGLVLAGTSGALVVGRWLSRRRGAAPRDENAPPKRETETDEDEDEKRGRAEVDAEVPAGKDESEPQVTTHAKKTEDEKKSSRSAKRTVANEEPKKRARPAPPASARLEGFVCQLGDVLMRLTGEEAWLAGGVVFSEDLPVAVLFVAPDAGHDCAIWTRARPKGGLFWLEPLDPNAVLVGGEPPSSVEHGGIRFDRARRLPLHARRIGVGAPDVGDSAVVAEYVSAGAERLLVMKASSGLVQAYRGLELEEGSFEVIASGDTTLDSA